MQGQIQLNTTDKMLDRLPETSKRQQANECTMFIMSNSNRYKYKILIAISLKGVDFDSAKIILSDLT